MPQNDCDNPAKQWFHHKWQFQLYASSFWLFSTSLSVKILSLERRESDSWWSPRCYSRYKIIIFVSILSALSQCQRFWLLCHCCYQACFHGTENLNKAQVLHFVLEISTGTLSPLRSIRPQGAWCTSKYTVTCNIFTTGLTDLWERLMRFKNIQICANGLSDLYYGCLLTLF
jgi:hypothetical protein